MVLKKSNVRTKSTEQKEAEYCPKEKEILAVLEAKEKSLNGQEMRIDSRRKWLSWIGKKSEAGREVVLAVGRQPGRRAGHFLG